MTADESISKTSQETTGRNDPLRYAYSLSKWEDKRCLFDPAQTPSCACVCLHTVHTHWGLGAGG